jgi:hypothetical protein
VDWLPERVNENKEKTVNIWHYRGLFPKGRLIGRIKAKSDNGTDLDFTSPNHKSFIF